MKKLFFFIKLIRIWQKVSDPNGSGSTTLKDRILHFVSVCRSRRVRIPDSLGAAGLFFPAGQRSSQHGVARQLQVSKHPSCQLEGFTTVYCGTGIISRHQCCESMTFWYGSGMSQNVWIILIRSTGTFTSFFKDKKS